MKRLNQYEFQLTRSLTPSLKLRNFTLVVLCGDIITANCQGVKLFSQTQ